MTCSNQNSVKLSESFFRNNVLEKTEKRTHGIWFRLSRVWSKYFSHLEINYFTIGHREKIILKMTVFKYTSVPLSRSLWEEILLSIISQKAYSMWSIVNNSLLNNIRHLEKIFDHQTFFDNLADSEFIRPMFCSAIYRHPRRLLFVMSIAWDDIKREYFVKKSFLFSRNDIMKKIKYTRREKICRLMYELHYTIDQIWCVFIWKYSSLVKRDEHWKNLNYLDKETIHQNDHRPPSDWGSHVK